jgi:lipopolysaccharide transport system permease protein
LGLSWAFIQPIVLLLLYTFIFSFVLQIRYGDDDTTAGFSAYLFCGLLPWFAFAEGVTRSASVIIANSNLIKKVVFPSEILPAYVVVSALIIEFIGLAVFCLFVGAFYGGLGWELALLSLVIAAQFLFTMGVSWFVASINVFLRDVGQAMGLVMTTWMFLTPIFYPAHLIPDRFRFILGFNPMFYIVEAYRDLILEGQIPSLLEAVGLAGMALSTFVAGHWFFRRSNKAFVDVL